MKPTAIILHPKHWAGKEGLYNYVHVSIGGKVPRKRNGIPTYDGYAEVVTPEGVKALEAAFMKHKPAVFLYWLHAGMSTVILNKLKKISPNTRFIFWFGNHRQRVTGNVNSFKRFVDCLCLNSDDPGQKKMYKNFGVRYVETLWDGFDPDEVVLSQAPPKYDCFFGGQTYMELGQQKAKLNFPGGKLRYEFIRACHERFNTIVRSARKGWPFEVKPEMYHPRYTNALREAKITLNVNHYPNFEKAYTRRTIRSIFAGRLHATWYIPRMEEDFTNHENIVWFKTIEEGLDLVEYYLNHDEERERIAANCLKLAKEKFTFEHRRKDFERFTRPLLEEFYRKEKRLPAKQRKKKKK